MVIVIVMVMGMVMVIVTQHSAEVAIQTEREVMVISCHQN